MVEERPPISHQKRHQIMMCQESRIGRSLVIFLLIGTAMTVYSLIRTEVKGELTPTEQILCPGTIGVCFIISFAIVANSISQGLSHACTDQKTYFRLATISEHQENVCIICLGKINVDDKFNIPVELSCKHYFHSECIEQWLTKYKKSCPQCRRVPQVYRMPSPFEKGMRKIFFCQQKRQTYIDRDPVQITLVNAKDAPSSPNASHVSVWM